MKINNEHGAAFMVTLFGLVVLLSISSIFVLRTVHESRMSQLERNSSQALYLGEAAAQEGLDQLDILINGYMMNTLSSWNPSVVVTQVNNYINQSDPDGIGFLILAVQDAGTQLLTANGIWGEYSDAGTLGAHPYTYTISIKEKTDPVVVTPDTWDFAYAFIVEGVGTVNSVEREMVIEGDFTVRVQRDNFAKYALFTNEQELPDGTQVWFTNNTNFAGPLHTNKRFNFALNPSGTFEGVVNQVEDQARFYNGGFTVLLDADVNGTTDVPTFEAGFNRGQSPITLSSPVQQQDMIDQATGSNSYSTDGIYVPNNGTSLTGGIYVRGNSAISMSVDGSNNAVYTISQGGVTQTITVDAVNNLTSIHDSSSGTVSTYNGKPDGIDDVGTLIYVDGEVQGLAGTVQEDTEVTIASSNDMIIQDHVRYENYTPAVGAPGTSGYVPPHANGAKNLLGLVTWNGDVRIGTSAPDNIDVHGTILAQNGLLTVDDYGDTGEGSRGTATLLGGVIQDNYGAFGLFNGSTGNHISGYGRNFAYDERMQVGTAPPYFPSLNTFIAFTNDIADKLGWHEGEEL